MGYKGIDVSAYQGKPTWSMVKEAGIKFAILRAHARREKDASFEHNYKGCVGNGIPVGVYRFSYALTVDTAKTEAQELLKVLDGRKLDLGVWLDLEWNMQRKLGSAAVKKIANVWMQTIREAGYECNIYCNLDWYKNVCGGLDCKYWIARYPAKDEGYAVSSLKPNVGEIAWQYSSKGKVPGISGNVDMNMWYGDLPEEKDEAVDDAIWDKDAVKSLQQALNADGIRDKNGKQLSIDGIKGKMTDSAIKKVLLESGAFDTKKGRYTVGSKGELVKWMQMRLNTIIGDHLVEMLGNGLTADGYLGADTRSAIGLFQGLKGLKKDYKAGANTITEMLRV